MHVLIIPSHLYMPPNDHMSGIFQKHQAEALSLNGFQVGILSPGIISLKHIFRKYDYPYQSENNGINILRNWKRSSFLNRHIFGELRLKKYLKIGHQLFNDYVNKFGKPDILHAHNAINAGYLAKKIKISSGIPYVVTEHNSSYERNLYGKYEINRTKSAYEDADKVLAVSLSLKHTINKLFNNDIRCEVIPNIIDKKFKYPLLNEKKFQSKEFIFLNVGRFDRNKNQKDIIYAFKRISEEVNTRLKFVGYGPTESDLKKMVNNLNLNDKVDFLGLLPPGDVVKQMQDANVFVLSSFVETFGVVLTEALACGCVLISTKSGGPEDIITDQNGVLVSNNDINELYQAMLDVYNNYPAYDLPYISKTVINQYGHEAVAKKLNKVYSRVLNNKERGV